MDSAKLKKIRSGHRGFITKQINTIDERKNDAQKLKQLEMQLKEKLQTVKDLDEKILERIAEKEGESETEGADEVSKEIEDAAAFQDKVNSAIISIQELLLPNKPTIVSEPSVSLGRPTYEYVRKVRAKLPKLELRKFSGKPQDWQEFWDGFESAVHGNEELSSIDKFSYLKYYLEDAAKKVISGLELTERNYRVAVEILKDRFAKPTLIKQAHIRDMMNLSPVFNEKNIKRMRDLYDSLETHFRGLEALGVYQESYSCIVVPTVMEKIPDAVRLNMIRGIKNLDEWTMEALLYAFKEELEIRERNQPTFKATRHDDDMKSRFTGKAPTSGSTLHATTNMDSGERGKKFCVFCKGNHEEICCKNVVNIKERKNIISKYGRCFCCLKRNHKAFECRSKFFCVKCNQKHHPSICDRPNRGNEINDLSVDAKSFSPSAATQPASLTNATSCLGNVENGGRVALQTAQAILRGNQVVKARVLFDTGSHRTFVTQDIVDLLGKAPFKQESLAIRTFGSDKVEEKMRDVVELELYSVADSKPIRIVASVVQHISEIRNEHPEIVKHEFPHLAKIWFSDVSPRQDSLTIDLLIGNDFLHELQEDRVIRGEPGEPVAVQTKLGWVLSGPLKGKVVGSHKNINVNLIHDPLPNFHIDSSAKLNGEVQKLWDLETLGIRSTDEVHEELLDNVTFNGERYSVKLPWKVGHKPLPSNFQNSLYRLKGQLRKLKKEPHILEAYDGIIKDQLQQKVIEKVAELEATGKEHYLPHHAVVRDNAETTKIRIVYDASSKEGKTGTSLNNCLHVGPPLTPLLFEILLRFREFRVPMVADIEKAFLNVEIDKEDRDVLRFLWVKDIHNENSPIEVYRFNRVVFGVNSSPFLLNGVLRHHLSKFKELDPEFATTLANNFYVDDLVFGASNVDDARNLHLKAIERMKEGGFNLRKWKSSNAELLQEFQKSDPSYIPSQEEEGTYAKETLGNIVEDGKTKVLGIPWDTAGDKFEFDLSKIGELIEGEKITKRKVLSSIAKLFDPLGIISPITVSMKILFQELCVEQYEWDEELNLDKKEKWESIIENLRSVGKISLPRCLYEENATNVRNCWLHGFADASQRAYSAMIYLVYESDSGVKSQLICSKTRVTPLKKLSIPRLELMSARILATLMKVVFSALKSQVTIEGCRYWLDSKTALYWINNAGEWKQFVQHRVDEILKLTDKKDWGHCAGVCNPADLGSRGVLASELVNKRIWWQGPHWLLMEREHWPTELLLDSTSDVNEEKKKSSVTLATVQDRPTGISKIIDINTFSSIDRLFRVTAYVLRFIANLKAKGNNSAVPIKLEELNAEELKHAETKWVIDSQISIRNDPKFNQLSCNLGLIEEDSILRCKGRLGNSDLELEGKYPILLPKEGKFTELLVYSCHDRVFHNGLKSTLAEIRSRYWIPQGRQSVKKLLRKCIVCKKAQGKAYSAPQMAELPQFRVQKTPPFLNVGIDFAGPLYSKAKTGKMEKCYVVLYVCCTSRALHLDLIDDLSGPTFIRSLRRFTARRGTPDLINSDNAKTFKFTNKFLHKLASDHSVVAFLQSKRINWKFNLERSPWWGGHFERLVGSVKRCLRKILGNARLSFDELHTVLIEIEWTLNSRPLTYLYDELGYEVLTPFHLMYGRRLPQLAEGVQYNTENADEDSPAYCKRFLFLIKKLSHFWTRWSREYLTDLREVHRINNGKNPETQIGDVVLIKEDNAHRGNWKMGVVSDLITGKDGIARGAKVRIAGKGKPDFLYRPLQKLYPFEVKSADVDSSSNKVQYREREKNDCEQGVAFRPKRAAAKDAIWKTRLVLDSD